MEKAIIKKLINNFLKHNKNLKNNEIIFDNSIDEKYKNLNIKQIFEYFNNLNEKIEH